MKREVRRILVLLAAAVCLLACAAQAADFYVAPDGDDANPGTQQQPFATLARARDAVRPLVAKGLDRNVTVLIRGGTYRITEPVAFGPEDSGTDRFSITYAACENEKPVTSGGRVIRGWKAQGDGTWTAEIPDAKQGQWTFRELFVDGRRAQRARHPNTGHLRVDKVGEDRRTSFRFKAGDLRAYRGLEHVEMVFLHDWAITRTPVLAIDEPTRTLRVPQQVGGPTSWGAMDWFEKQPRYYLENSKDMLDAPGEWFLDQETGVLSYRPRAGEKIDAVEAVAPVADQLLVVRGNLAENRPVRNLHFVGLSFEHAAWSPPGGVYWGRQACTYWTPGTVEAGRSHEEADPAAVQFDLAEGCRFEDGRVEHAGRSGIWLGRGCLGCRIVGSVVSDTGGNGVMIGEGQARQIGDQGWWEASPEQAASGNVVANSVVRESGRELFGAVGVWVGLAAKTTIAHNEISHHPYTGVSVGWMWWNPRSRPEPRSTPARENVVADNHIHHVMQILSDGGGIYTLGTQPGSALRGNLIHDVRRNAGRAESNGMFLDQGTGEFTIEGNVIYGIDRSPLRFHKGWENVVRDNVLQVGGDMPPVRYNDTRQERIRLEDNTVVEGGPELEKAIEAARCRAGLEPAYRQKLSGQ